jgi:two-component system sensor histidine kinase AtoS
MVGVRRSWLLMNNSTQLPSFTLRRHNPGLAEIEVLLDRFTEAMLVVNSQNMRIVMANTRATELTAYTRAELAGMNFRNLFTRWDESAFWQEEAGSSPSWQLTLVRRNKSRQDVQIEIGSISPHGKWILATLTPVSALQQEAAEEQRRLQALDNLARLAQAAQQPSLEAALQVALEAGRALTGAATIALYQADAGQLALKRYGEWGNELPEQLPSQDLIHLRTPYIWTPGKRTLSNLHRTARSQQLAYVATAPLGQANALIGLVAIGDAQNTPSADTTAYLGIVAATLTSLFQQQTLARNLQDTLLRQQLHLQTQETAERYASDGLIVLNPDLTIMRINPAAESALGYYRHEVQGQPIEKILIGTDSLEPAFNAARHNVPTLYMDDVRLYRRSGQGFLAQVRILPVTEEQELKGIIVLLRDLSEQEEIQLRAQQLEQRALLGEVTAAFAHEVRNPIHSISTGLQLMEMKLPEGDPNRDLASKLVQECDRLAELMKSVLAFSRPVEYQMEPVDMEALTCRLLDKLNSRIGRSNIQFIHKIEPNTPPVNGNARALEQVFTNLVTNAVQALGEKGGMVSVKLQPVKAPDGRQYIEVSVADDGPGIPKEDQERVFQPFFTTKPDGTGLGLAITKRIITAHKGTIQLNSFPGGTVFYIYLPAASPAAAAGTVAQPIVPATL